MKDIIAPAVIIVCLVAICLAAGISIALDASTLLWSKIITITILLALIMTGIFVLIERIQEIRGGEEDDLSDY